MAKEKLGYIDVDKLIPQITLEQTAAFYGVDMGELHRTGQEIRTRCFLVCGKTEETGDRALAISADDPSKRWKCHQYDCQKGGNLVGLCDLLKPGTSGGGRPRGDRFKAIARDLQAMAQGESCSQGAASTPESKPVPPPENPKPRETNVPLKDSANERARVLVELDEKFTTDVALMPPQAASYFRRRAYLIPEVCEQWRMGYLGRDAGGDRVGGTMRGKVVYSILDTCGDVLTWFGRDPEFEEKHKKWVAANKEGKEPAKFHFVRGFHRGQELFGQHQVQNLQAEARQKIEELGLVVVEGPNDVIRMDCLGDFAVGLTSNRVTDEQVNRIVDLAAQYAGGRVSLMLDCDEEGERGAQEVLKRLAERCYVRLAWSAKSNGGKYAGRQPESLSSDQWKELRATLVKSQGRRPAGNLQQPSQP